MTEPAPTELPGPLLSRLAACARVVVLDQVGSTNDYALGLRAAGEPAVVLARHQTRGRGRFRRHWYSDDASLCFSLLLCRDHPDFPGSLITHIAGLAACRALESTTGTKPLIRWPNDIMLGEKKIAGILCEARGNGVAVGFGINVNQPSFPENLPDATSLLMATGQTFDKLVLLEACVKETFAALDQAVKDQGAALLTQLKERSAILHRRVEVKTLLRTHIGTCIDIDREGRLVLRTDSGKVLSLSAGDVRRLR
ncbi:MAG: biotin--[acetyl-CoA-carboxylase] ligase [candidate division WOR-3 bacterium]